MIEKNNLTKTETSIIINKNLFQRFITLKKKLRIKKKDSLHLFFQEFTEYSLITIFFS
jgi:hypothetical protein